MRLRRRRMIVHNPPTVGGAAKDERKATVRLVFCAFEFPTTEGDGGVFSERRYFKIGKSKCAHFLAVGIFFLVTIAHGLPAACDGVFGYERCRIRAGLAVRAELAAAARVSVHESVDVASIPGFLLPADDGANLFGCFGSCDCGNVCCCQEYRRHHECWINS